MAQQRSSLEWILEAVALTALAASFGTVLAHWSELPATIPRHFEASGRPNQWGSKTGLWLLPLVSTGIYLVLTAASRYQNLINMPISVNRELPEVQRLLLSMLSTLKATVLLNFLYIVSSSIHTALGLSEGLGKSFLPVFLLTIFLPLGFYLFQLRRYQNR